MTKSVKPREKRTWREFGNLHRLDGPAINHEDGYVEYWVNGLLHRLDGPAIITKNADHYYYQFGQLHRDDGPAVDEADGTKKWYQRGQFHREDGPAVEHADGAKIWYRHNQIHREDGPAYSTGYGDEWWLNGLKYEFKNWIKKFAGPIKISNSGLDDDCEGHKWYLNGKLHKEDEPAEVYVDENGELISSFWYYEGKLHRDDGPAVLDTDSSGNGDQAVIWYKHGKKHRIDGPAIIWDTETSPTYEWWLNDKKFTTLEKYLMYSGISQEQKVLIKLQYG